MERIKMQNPIAELDGDEMTRVIWHMIKEELILPFVELNTEYYDLSLPNREKTRDAVTVEAADAIKRLKIGVKCATITPNLQRKEEYGLSELWRSPNATIRAALDGTVFRAPILISKVKPVVSCWKRPITIARHAYGDLYRAVEYRVQRNSCLRMKMAGSFRGRRFIISGVRALCRPCTTATIRSCPLRAAALPMRWM